MRAKSVEKLINIFGVALLIGAFACIILMVSLRYENLWVWYEKYNEALRSLEKYILSIEPQWLFVAVIGAVYLLKTFVPILPLSTICFITGVVLPTYLAIQVNLGGVILIMTIRYYWGKYRGKGATWYFIKKNTTLRELIEQEGSGNPWLLFALRLLPLAPLNSISRLYGAMDFGYTNYMIISLLGFLPKLISYTIIGRNVYDPFSAAFLTPIILLLLISGLLLLSLNAVWSFVRKNVKFQKRKRKIKR